ncbi:MAG: YggT family protein [Simkaniaceae bacterium]
MAILIYIVTLCFSTYQLLLLARILGTWIPSFTRSRYMHFLSFYTEPFLNLFRRILPPIGGRLDLSPILALLTLGFLKRLTLYLIMR